MAEDRSAVAFFLNATCRPTTSLTVPLARRRKHTRNRTRLPCLYSCTAEEPRRRLNGGCANAEPRTRKPPGKHSSSDFAERVLRWLVATSSFPGEQMGPDAWSGDAARPKGRAVEHPRASERYLNFALSKTCRVCVAARHRFLLSMPCVVSAAWMYRRQKVDAAKSSSSAAVSARSNQRTAPSLPPSHR